MGRMAAYGRFGPPGTVGERPAGVDVKPDSGIAAADVNDRGEPDQM
jgi:hypothetical protein